MDKEYFCFHIKVCPVLHIKPIVIHNELRTVFGDEAPPLRTVQRWSKWFREGREEVEDEERPGRPITETTHENMRQVRDLINDDPYVTVGELKVQSDVWRLCHIVIGDESRLYHKQIGRKSSNATLVTSGDPPPKMVLHSHFAPRTLLPIFFQSTSSVLIHSVKRGQTMDH
ncbi:unnamed protein product [Rotaria sordida]|uniref:Mos1 transposase HTH domain-containing protein n=1 Tax=Rotaria sordida TaxID=392033 RepID=A0A814G251_9BILA|nr:unnamed protein product [Rotaria sordida]CAF4141503.1 unnamed protein product [Rotaria sordida]